MTAAVRSPVSASSRRFEIVRRDDTLRVEGELRVGDAAGVWRELHALTREVPRGRLDLDLARASIVDGAIMSLLVELRAELAARGVRADLVAVPPSVRPIVHLYRGDQAPEPPVAPSLVPLLERIGRGAAELFARARRLAVFAGELVAAAAGVLRSPRSLNLRSIFPLAERAGIDALPIVLLLNFLVGFVMAYQSARQLALYGANVYVADVVGISLTRELVPLMTGIIMSGRSGAAFAAELGAMKVSEEIDALRTLGLSPHRWLVVPRVVALVLVAPALTLLGDVVGVAGGAVVAAASLDVSAGSYLAELRTAVFAADVEIGLVKGAAYGAAIAVIGCHQGLATTGGAAGVGRRTTATVVVCLFTIVIVDTLLTLFFRILGL